MGKRRTYKKQTDLCQVCLSVQPVGETGIWEHSVFHFPKMLEGLKRHPSNNGCDKQPVQCPLVETFPREVILVKAERHDAKTNQDGAKEHFPFRKSSIPHCIACETVYRDSIYCQSER